MGWTNATQSSDIESLLRRPNLQRSTDHEFGSRHHQRLGRGDRILLPSVIPAQVQGRQFTHNEKYPYDWVSAPRPAPPVERRGTTPGDTTHLGRNELEGEGLGKNHDTVRVGHGKDLTFSIHKPQ